MIKLEPGTLLKQNKVCYSSLKLKDQDSLKVQRLHQIPAKWWAYRLLSKVPLQGWSDDLRCISASWSSGTRTRSGSSGARTSPAGLLAGPWLAAPRSDIPQKSYYKGREVKMKLKKVRTWSNQKFWNQEKERYFLSCSIQQGSKWCFTYLLPVLSFLGLMLTLLNSENQSSQGATS